MATSKTEADMKIRLSLLRGLLHDGNLSLRLSAELDAIQNHGFKGWTEWLRKNYSRRKY